uniref:Uncharacterized protein n=1 Tax=Arundo donax TaxID=35708 RepID=A0A0A9GZM4_ARUDO
MHLYTQYTDMTINLGTNLSGSALDSNHRTPCETSANKQSEVAAAAAPASHSSLSRPHTLKAVVRAEEWQESPVRW